jgi:hypothetical protein
MNTPWGPSQQQYKITEGVYEVNRARHGGILAQDLLPQIEISPESFRLAGITYELKIRLNKEIMRNLQEILDEACDIGGCENPKVIADWYEFARGSDGLITNRSNIILYKDGGDWGENDEDGHYTGTGLLFCREDLDLTVNPHTTLYRVHIPDTSGQDKLLACCDELIDNLARGNADNLNTIREYLMSIINDQTAWKSLHHLMKELGLDYEDEDEDEDL